MGALEGKTVMITGAAQRLGRAIALHLAAQGADIALTYLRSEKQARATEERIRAYGVRAAAIPCDVREERSVQRAVNRAVRELGKLDILINNAGVYEAVPMGEITVAQWDNMFAVNTRGPFLVARAAHPALRKARGKIINLGSLGATRPWPGRAHYCASKAALRMLTQAMARAFAPEVAVNSVDPGMIGLGDRKQAALRRRLLARTPMRQNGSASDVAAAVLFFATAPHFITGQSLVVDGGLGLT